MYKGSLLDYSWKKRIADTKKTLRSHHFIEKYRLRKHLSGILSIDIDESDLEKKKNQFINDISDYNNKHIIQCYNKNVSNIPEETCYISSITPTGFINGQDESRCYVNSSFQVLFFNIYFIKLIMNIDCGYLMKSLDNREDDYRGYIQTFMILQVIQHIFVKW